MCYLPIPPNRPDFITLCYLVESKNLEVPHHAFFFQPIAASYYSSGLNSLITIIIINIILSLVTGLFFLVLLLNQR